MAAGNIKHILVPLDGSKSSEKGLTRAIYLSKLTGATITGVTVVTVQPTLASTVVKYKKFLTEKSQERLDKLKDKCEKDGITFKTKILYGKPSNEIAKYAQKEKYDLVVIGSRGLSGLKRTVLGSIASAIVQKSKVEVLVVK